VPTLPQPAWVMRFAQIQRVFWRSRGGGSKLRISLKVGRRPIPSMNTSRKCVCPPQIVYAYLASGGFAPRPHWGSASGPHWGTSVLQTLCAHPIQILATPLDQISRRGIGGPETESSFACFIQTLMFISRKFVGAKSVVFGGMAKFATWRGGLAPQTSPCPRP